MNHIFVHICYYVFRLKEVVQRMDEQQQQAVDRLAGELDSAQGRAAQLDEVQISIHY